MLLSRYRIMGSRLCNLFEDRAPVDKIYGCPISKWAAVTLIKISHQAISPNNNHHGDMPYIFMLWVWQYPTWHRIDCPILIDKELDQSNGESPGVDALRAELFHDDVIKWKHFPVTGHLCVEFTGPRWIPRTKANDAELLCFLWSAPE